MTRSNLKELLKVLEEIRKKEYPEVPAEVIEQIVIAQFDNQDNRVQARSRTIKIVSEFLSSATASEEEG